MALPFLILVAGLGLAGVVGFAVYEAIQENKKHAQKNSWLRRQKKYWTGVHSV